MESERDFANVTDTPGEIDAQNFNNMMNESYYKPMDVNATPFHGKISQLENQQFEDGDEFFDNFMNIFEEINKLSVPIKFKQRKYGGDRDKPLLLLYGEMGN